MRFPELILQNVYTRKTRSLLTGFAISVSIMTVVTMGVLTSSLRQSAISILRTGTADFSIAQKDVSDVIYSAVDETDLGGIKADPGVESVVGVLVAPFKLDDNHPFFLQIGVPPDELRQFGVDVVAGRAYGATASKETMLGYRAAREFGKSVGDHMTLNGNDYEIVGIYSTGQVFGDSASMLPLVTLQANERKPGTVTLAFVKTKPGTDIEGLRAKIEHDLPQLATVRTESDFGRVDRNLELLSAANTGVSALALVLGAVTVLNMMVLSVFERTREFGVLRAVGWSRRRILMEVMGEAFVVTLVGAVLGVIAAFVAIRLLEDVEALRGLFNPVYGTDVFLRALVITFGMAGFGAFYPAARAALLRPLAAIRHE
jgi:putative ABC transport system permease protein